MDSRNIVEIKDEKDDFYSNDDLYNITSWGADLSFRELITMYDEKDLLKPELQRKYIWDKSEASRFIESLLMGLPVPSIFLSERPSDNRKLIIDGYQRIMTVYDYVKGIFSKDNKIFKLSNSEKINEKWRGKAFKELNPRDQRKIKTSTIHAINFRQIHPEEDDTSLYQIFERINTSGRTLMPQEIRNCVYQGNCNDFLFEMNDFEIWRKLFGQIKPDSRMRDMEFILRFFALKSNEIKESEKTQISLKQFLNVFMGSDESKDPKVLEDRKQEFKNTMIYIHNNLGIDAFHNISPKDRRVYANRFHPTIFDAISISTSYALQKVPNIEINNIKERKFRLLGDEEFVEFTTNRTTNIKHINGRIAKALDFLYDMEYE